MLRDTLLACLDLSIRYNRVGKRLIGSSLGRTMELTIIIQSSSCSMFYDSLDRTTPKLHRLLPFLQLADIIHLHEQPSNVASETALECVRRIIWGMLYVNDAGIVSRSPRGLGRMMAVFVEVFDTFSLTISKSKTETTCMPIPRAPAAKIVFNATGQQYRQTTSFTYLGGTVTETPHLSDEIDRRIRAGWIGFKRYTQELCDRPKASLLPLKARMVRFELVGALLYGCATWTP